MDHTLATDQLRVRYLLGDLSEEQQIQLEKECFADDEAFERLLMVEGELNDAYVRGELSGRDRQLFERSVLGSPRRRQRVEFARAFTRCVSGAPVDPMSGPALSRESRVWWLPSFALRAGRHSEPANELRQSPHRRRVLLWSSATAVVLAVFVGWWLVVEAWRLRGELAATQAEYASLQREVQRLHQELERHRGHSDQLAAALRREQAERARQAEELSRPQHRPELRIASAVLVAGLVRGGTEPTRVIVPPGVEMLEVYIDLEASDDDRYRAVLRTPEGEAVWSHNALKARQTSLGKAVVVQLPTRVIMRQAYVLTLRRVTAGGTREDVGEYYFRILKR